MLGTSERRHTGKRGEFCSGSDAPDERIVVFESMATNLVPDDTNRQRDVFVRDRREGRPNVGAGVGKDLLTGRSSQ